MAEIHVVERGQLFTESYRLYYENAEGAVISPFHDIPLIHSSENEENIYNMVVEIPRWTNAKMEISRTEPMNPIMQDVKKGQVRFVGNVFPHRGYIWNYGAFPQTWEDPSHHDGRTDAKGDNDPIDVCDISNVVCHRGSVIKVKVLGCLAMIDDGETDWKILAINVEDKLARHMNNVRDIEKYKPGYLHATIEWFKYYKSAEGKGPNEFAFKSLFQGRSFAESVVEETHQLWKKLITPPEEKKESSSSSSESEEDENGERRKKKKKKGFFEKLVDKVEDAIDGSDKSDDEKDEEKKQEEEEKKADEEEKAEDAEIKEPEAAEEESAEIVAEEPKDIAEDTFYRGIQCANTSVLDSKFNISIERSSKFVTYCAEFNPEAHAACSNLANDFYFVNAAEVPFVEELLEDVEAIAENDKKEDDNEMQTANEELNAAGDHEGAAVEEDAREQFEDQRQDADENREESDVVRSEESPSEVQDHQESESTPAYEE